MHPTAYRRQHIPLRALKQDGGGRALLEREGRSVTLTLHATGLATGRVALYAYAPGCEAWRVREVSVPPDGTLALACDPLRAGDALLPADTPLCALLLAAEEPRREGLLLGTLPGASLPDVREAFWRALHPPQAPPPCPNVAAWAAPALSAAAPFQAAPPVSMTAPFASADILPVTEPFQVAPPAPISALSAPADIPPVAAPSAPSTPPVLTTATALHVPSSVPATLAQATASSVPSVSEMPAQATASPVPHIPATLAPGTFSPTPPSALVPSASMDASPAPPLRVALRLRRARWRAPAEATYPAIDPLTHVPAEMRRVEDAPLAPMTQDAPAPAPAAMRGILQPAPDATPPVAYRQGEGRPLDALRPVRWPAAVQPLQKLLEAHRPRSPFGERDWRYVRVPMACGGSDPYFWVGVKVEGDRVVKVAYALSGAADTPPPRGAAGYRWRQGERGGYWTLTRMVREE